MNLVSRSTDYAIRALVFMAPKTKTGLSTVDLDRALALPRPFMRKTLQQLQKAGYLSSVKGVGGGFKLEYPPRKIRLSDLITIFQGEISLGDCLFKKKLCHGVKTCPLRREIKTMETMLIGRLRKITLANLIAARSQGR